MIGTAAKRLQNCIKIVWMFCVTYSTWSDDILSCEVMKLLMLGLKNLAMTLFFLLTALTLRTVLVHNDTTPQGGAITAKTGVTTSDDIKRKRQRWEIEFRIICVNI